MFVFFDLGQTLVDLDGLIACIAARVRSEYPRLTVDATDLSARWIRTSFAELPRKGGLPFEREIDVAARVFGRLLSAAGVAISDAEAEGLLRRSWDDFEERVAFCPGVSVAWLEEVKALSAGLAIVTDGDSVNVDRLVRRTGIGKYFDAIVTSEAVRAYKPDPRIYHAALKGLDAEPGRSLFVSDTVLDLQGAAAVGMRTVFLPRRLLSASEEGLPVGAWRLKSPADLLKVLRGSHPPA